MDHFPVLLKEVIEWLAPREGDIFVDGTLGAGGHTEEILKLILPAGKLYAFDADLSAIDLVRKRLSLGQNLFLVHSNFANMSQELTERGVHQVNGILLDIGVSSMQIDQGHRGFSFRDDLDSELDMRMDQSRGVSAKEFIYSATQKELESVIKEFGEERYWRKIAAAIVNARKKKSINSTKDLAELIRSVIPGPKGKIDKATRTFQAIRIQVNRELEVLKEVIPQAIQLLKPGGRLGVITFHSLEDRVVKWLYRDFKDQGLINILTKKPIVAGEKELNQNARSRSAKFRVLEKI